MIILLAGHETSRNLIGNGLHWLLSNSCDFHEFDDDLAQRLAVDEILRLSSPVTMMGRIATEDFEFAGASLRKGDYVFLAWTSANRDPEQFPEPDRMDLRRRNNPHLAFGAGPHLPRPAFCVHRGSDRVSAPVAATAESSSRRATSRMEPDASRSWSHPPACGVDRPS
jgi:hypothetical protein